MTGYTSQRIKKNQKIQRILVKSAQSLQLKNTMEKFRSVDRKYRCKMLI